MINKKQDRTKILFLDIENSPSLGWVWKKYETDVIDFKQEWYMLSFAYKWFGEKSAKVVSLPSFKERYKKNKTNDEQLLLVLWTLLDKADIVIGHNVDRFDLRKINARFLAHGYLPPSPYKTVDTLKIAKRYFFLNSNKLTHLSQYLGVGEKVDTGGFGLWLDCMRGDKKAWKLMEKYNKNDVIITEKVYLALLPWISNHPNVNVLSGIKEACPKCGEKKLQRRGYAIAGNLKKQRLQCSGCGGWSQVKIEKQ